MNLTVRLESKTTLHQDDERTKHCTKTRKSLKKEINICENNLFKQNEGENHLSYIV